jgi:hypothetical protein
MASFVGVQSAFGVDQHGFSVSKGCEPGPLHPGDALLCSYTISNTLPTVVHETWTIKSVIDTITAPSGVHVTGEELPGLSLTFVQGSSLTPPSCNGTQTVCTLPYGTSIETADIQTYTVQLADQAAPDPTLNDLVTVVGNDVCDAGSSNCSTADAPQTAPASTTVSIFLGNVTTALSASVVRVGATVHDTAMITGGSTKLPSGTVDYSVFSDNACTKLVQDLGSVTVQADGSVPPSADYTTTTTGIFWFQANYSGDTFNAGKKSLCTSEPLTVVDAKITIGPSATNPVGAPHTFTVTLSNDVGDGNGFVVAPGEHVDVTLTDSGGAAHTAPTGSCTTAGANTDVNGQCTITFTSNSAGTVTGHASSTLSVAGSAPFTVQTDGVAPNSGDAVKTFSDDVVSTKVLDASNSDVTNQTITSGTVVHDQATVSKASGTPASVPAPTGTVTFTLFASNNCTGTVVSGPETDPLVSGLATSSNFTTPASGGPFSYLAHYNGDGNYPAHDAGCEPFTVQPPGIANLTPGFWKNHRSATTPLLPQPLGNYTVHTFDQAVAVLSGMGCGSAGRINCMAGMLLAAELNLANGGVQCASVLSEVAAANQLLKDVGYNGPGVATSKTPTAAQLAQAQTLHDELSAYNIDGIPTC